MEVDSLNYRSMERTGFDLALFKRCFDLNDSPKSLELLRWQYFDVPVEGLNVELALDDLSGSDQIVAAVYATFPVTMRVGAGTCAGVQSIDTMTDSRYRGRGRFVNLAKRVYDRCIAEGKTVVYGMPNTSSARGFFTRLGWESFDPMPFMARPLRSGYVLEKLRLGGTLSKLFDAPLPLPTRPKAAMIANIRRVNTIDARFQAVWQAFSGDVTCGVERDTNYLQWRLARPGESYDVFGWFEGEALVGYVILGTRVTANGLTGKLMELLFDPSRPEVGAAMLSEALHLLRDRGCGIVWAWNFDHSVNHPTLKGAGFINLPERLWPLQLHVGMRDFSGANDVLHSKTNWYVSLLDCDTD